jgi:nucleoside phosphorylase
MLDSFDLPSEAKIYDYQWLVDAFDQVQQSVIVDGCAEAVVTLRKQHGFIRFIDAYAGLCRHCANRTDLRFHLDQLARSVHVEWEKLSGLWTRNHRTGEYELSGQSAIELADALGYLAERLEREFSLNTRTASPSEPPHSLHTPLIARTSPMPGEEAELVIFVALEEEFNILQRRWNLKRPFGIFAASGDINSIVVDVICAQNMGRVPAAVAMGFYFAKRKGKQPQLVLIVGLAGGFEEEDIEEGMIIIPQTVVDLATRKIRDEEEGTITEVRRREFLLVSTLYDYVTSSDFDLVAWRQAAIDDADWPAHRRPFLRRGLIASVDEVISSDPRRKGLLKSSPKLLGVEMEGGGVCAAAERYDVPVAMIRAVSDQADPAKADTKWRVRGMKTLAILMERIDWASVSARMKAD